MCIAWRVAMSAISYAIAVVIPVLCGAIWDLTGVPWTVFLPVGVCALTLTTLGNLAHAAQSGALKEAIMEWILYFPCRSV